MKREAKEGVGFFTKDGLLYRRWVPPDRGGEGEEMAFDQLVLPRQCRKMVLKLAHTIPLAGHLGRDKTILAIGRCCSIFSGLQFIEMLQHIVGLAGLVRKYLERGWAGYHLSHCQLSI